LYREFLEECARSSLKPAEAEIGAVAAVSSPEPSPQPPPSAEELREYIVGFSHSSKLMEEYVQTHLARLVRTIQITPAGGADDRALELGCYLQITPALRTYLGYGEVRGAYYGEVGKTDVRSTTSITGEVFSCTLDLFDAERDVFPYPDDHFRSVLCCELIEHLTSDPMHMLAEINRIVSPGGYLVLTTPNIAGLRSLHAVLNGYHPALFPSYIRPSGDGTVDPRHSREYTPIEIAQLVEAAGFRVEHLETGDYNEQAPSYEEARRVLEAHRLSTTLRGEVIFCRARKTGPLRDRWPKELYYPP
jgi:SAM-dependent methyltransferase